MTLNDLPEVGHVGFLCEDVDHFAGMFDSSRVRVYDFSPTRAWGYGRRPIDPASCRLRIALYSPEQGAKLEFVKYVSGENMCHKDYFEAHGDSIHHVAYYVNNFEEWHRYFSETEGCSIIFEAEIEDEAMGKRASFYGTAPGFPCVIEISTRPTKL